MEMLFAKDFLDEVGERPVSHVMQEGGELGELALLRVNATPAVMASCIIHAGGEVSGAERVREAGVLGAMKDEVEDAVLLDASKTLKALFIDDLADQLVEAVTREPNIAMHGVTEDVGSLKLG